MWCYPRDPRTISPSCCHGSWHDGDVQSVCCRSLSRHGVPCKGWCGASRCDARTRGAGRRWAPGGVPLFAVPASTCHGYSRDRAGLCRSDGGSHSSCSTYGRAGPRCVGRQGMWWDRRGGQGQQELLPIPLHSGEMRVERQTNRKVSGNLASCKEFRKILMTMDNGVVRP